MAAPMQQMPSQLIPGGLPESGPGMDFSLYAFNFINSTPYIGSGWQKTVGISERVGEAHELITAAVLATPGQPWQRLAHLCVQFEQNSFRESPDKATYGHKMRQKAAEMHARRQGQVPRLAQVEKAGVSNVPNQSTFRDTPDPIPQQAPQVGVSSKDGMNPQINPGQAGFSIPQGPDQQQLSDTDKQRIQALALNLMQQASDSQKQQMMENLAQRLDPQRLAQMRAQGQDPLEMLFQQEAAKRFMLARRHQMQQKHEMPPNTHGMTSRTGSNAESDGSRPPSVSDDHQQMSRRHHPNHSGGVIHRRQRLRQLNAQSLACIANKDTISKDNTMGEEAREAILLVNMARKISRMAQKTKKLEVGNGERWDRGKKVRKKSPLPPPVPR